MVVLRGSIYIHDTVKTIPVCTYTSKNQSAIRYDPYYHKFQLIYHWKDNWSNSADGFFSRAQELVEEDDKKKRALH